MKWIRLVRESEEDEQVEVHAYDIDWDTDGDDPEELGLPGKATVQVDASLVDDPDELEERVADLLADEYGYAVDNFTYEVE